MTPPPERTGPGPAPSPVLGPAVVYTREELDWVEREWAFHLHGRSAFMSREDFVQLQAWAGEGVPADIIVNAMEGFFERRARRSAARGFVALAHLVRDVAKAMKLRSAMDRAGHPGAAGAWTAVKEPLRADLRCRALFEAFQQLQAAAPAPDAPGFLEHFDAERKAYRELVAQAELRLGPGAEPLRAALRERLFESGMEEGSLVWKRAWDYHWRRAVCEAWGIPG